MRFDTINIPAFGPFTNFSLNFEKSSHDLHLIYGPNEAGKSSLLRGIHQMFYEIPGQSNDDFIHRKPDLRLGASISHGDKHLTFLRKKGNKNTLLDSSGNTIDDASLAPFLGSVNAEFFDKMFGLDTASLRSGAEALLSGEGDLGTQLFSASLGGTPIEKAIETLETEADSLFRGGSRKDKSILPALDTYRDGEKLAKESATKDSQWKALGKDLKQTEGEFKEADQELSTAQKEQIKLDALSKALPTYLKFKRLNQESKELSAPTVSSDFIQRFRDTLNEFKALERTIEQAKRSIETRQKDADQLTDASPILEQAPAIDALVAGLETHLANQSRLDRLSTEIAQLEQELKLAAEELELDDPQAIDQLATLPESTHSQFKQLAKALETQTREQKQAKEEVDNLQEEISKLREDLEALQDAADTSDLKALQDRCASHLSQTVQHDQREDEIASLAIRIGTLSKRLKLDQAEPDIAALAVPSEEFIRQQGERQQALETELKDYKQELESNQDARIKAQTKLDHLKRQAPIYQPDDLEKARKTRDELLVEIGAKTISNPKVQADWLNELTTAIAKADEVADALRDNAENIAEAAQIERVIDEADRQIETLEGRKGEASEALSTWQKEWTAHCSKVPLPAQSPTELLQWRAFWEELCEAIETHQTKQKLSNKHRDNQEKLSQALKAQLETEEADFESLSHELGHRLTSANQQQGKRQSKEESLSEKESKLPLAQAKQQEADQALSQTQKEWNRLCQEQQISPELPAETTLDLLDLRKESKQKHGELSALSEEQTKKSAAVRDFADRVNSLASSLLDEASSTAVDSLVSELRAKSDAAQKSNTKKSTLLDQIQTDREQLRAHTLTHKDLQAELSEFQTQAEVKELAAMEQVIIAIETKANLQKELSSTRETLESLAGSSELNAFCEQLEELDAEQLQVEISEIESNTEPLKHKRDAARQALDALQRQHAELQKASDAAAQHKQNATNALARIVTDVDRFIKLQHAITFLRDQVEAYRKESQGPMIEKTSHYFSALTEERYTGVAAQLDNKGRPQLVALLKGEQAEAPPREVPTTGLSEGTADQLYLSLRLAAIDLHLDKHTPIPLILDDLLITFDDARTQALLPVLAELSQKTQVLIFTHHSHLSHLAKKTVPTLQHHQLSQ